MKDWEETGNGSCALRRCSLGLDLDLLVNVDRLITVVGTGEAGKQGEKVKRHCIWLTGGRK